MKRTKKIALVMLAVVLMAVCFVFCASAETWGDYEYTVIEDGTVKITNYNGSATELVIPEVIDGKTVTVIGERSFSANKTIETLVVGNNIITIEESAFRVNSLKEITISDSVKSIGYWAFYGTAYYNDDVNWENGVLYIGNHLIKANVSGDFKIKEGTVTIANYAFDDCDDLHSLSIPNSVKNINFLGIGSFDFEKFYVDEANLVYSSDDSGVLYNKSKTVLIKYPAGNKQNHFDIPDTVTTIMFEAFYGAIYLTDVNVPESVNYIGAGAFAICINLKNININDNITELTLGVFMGCFSLENLYIPSTVKNIGNQAVWDNLGNDFYIAGMEVSFGDGNIFTGITGIQNITKEEFINKLNLSVTTDDENLRNSLWSEIEGYLTSLDEETYTGTIYCHSGSTAETYAIENGIDYELTHFFKGDWTYDYDNMVRTRKCIHCDELETEPLETTENGDVEIIEPVDPDTNFDVDEIKGDNFIVVEETVVNGIEGNAEVLRAFDITLKNKDGVHVQPDGTVKVKLPLDWTKDGIYKVYRVNDDGTLTDMNAYRQGSHMVFETDHFSIYVIVDVSEKSEADEPETPDTPDVPAEPDASDCNCICHKEGFFFEILASVFKFVSKLLGVFPTCDCGIAHY